MVRVTLSINYCWLQPFKYSFLDLVLFDIYKQGLKILFNEVNFKYTFAILFWLSSVISLVHIMQEKHKSSKPEAL